MFSSSKFSFGRQKVSKHFKKRQSITSLATEFSEQNLGQKVDEGIDPFDQGPLGESAAEPAPLKVEEDPLGNFQLHIAAPSTNFDEEEEEEKSEDSEQPTPSVTPSTEMTEEAIPFPSSDLAQNTVGPARLLVKDILFDEVTLAASAKAEANWERMMEKIVSSDKSLLTQPDSPTKKKEDPFAPPPALLPKDPSEKATKAAMKRLSLQPSSAPELSVAVMVNVILERRRWIWRKVSDVDSNTEQEQTFEDPSELWAMKPKGHKELIQEALQSKSGTAKLKFSFPSVRAVKSCKGCSGTGTATCKECEGIEADECFWCDGKGKSVYKNKPSSSCQRCKGTGRYYCSTCENAPKKQCGDCKGNTSVTSELGCAIDLKSMRLPVITVAAYTNEEERFELLSTVCEKINNMSPSARNASSGGGRSRSNSVISQISVCDTIASSRRDSIFDPQTPPRDNTWYPVTAHCKLEQFLTTTVVVDQITSTPRVMGGLRSRRDSNVSVRSRTDSIVEGRRSSLYVVSSLDNVPVQKITTRNRRSSSIISQDSPTDSRRSSVYGRPLSQQRPSSLLHSNSSLDRPGFPQSPLSASERPEGIKHSQSTNDLPPMPALPAHYEQDNKIAKRASRLFPQNITVDTLPE
ncbi:hypothetical protein CBS101457_002420 [Exobasidium rhododendri]|nr:hypothetical protein CBS101457_002420 [Exobasidium rhododendri]